MKTDQYLPPEISDKARRQFVAKAEQATMASAWEQMTADLEEGQAARRAMPSLEARLARLEAKQPTLKATLLPAPAQTGPTYEPIKSAADIVAAAALAEFRRFASGAEPSQTLRELWPDEAKRHWRKAARTLAKSATETGTTTHSTFGADLISADVGPWIAALEHTSVFGALMGAGGVSLPMGRNRALTYPTRGASDRGALAAAFVAENATIPVKSGTVASRFFEQCKAGVITTATNELMAVSVPNAFDLFRAMIVDDTSEMLDAALLDPANDILSGIRPASPWFGAATRPSTGTELVNIIADLAWLIGTIRPAKPRNPVLVIDHMREQRLRMTRDDSGWVFRDELQQGTLSGVPVIVSPTVPADKVYCIDAADFASWLPAPEIDISRSATLVMANDDGAAPTMADTNAVSVDGSLKVSDAASAIPAAEVINTFQMNASALRLVQPVAWGTLRTGTASWISDVTW
ncbi:phage major capsid protein [Tateyamaria sp.]|uniref:phage major capsid protein n=1 Tax=Tateyamaria sp. TaxID=1929288 RepID=UPI00329BFD62